MADMLSRTVSTPAGDTPVVPVLLVLVGGYLTWFGIHYWRSDIRYPTDPLKAVLTGKPIPDPDHSAQETALHGVVSGAQAYAGAHGTGTGTGGTAGSEDHSPGQGKTKGTLSKDEIKTLWTGHGGAADKANLAAAIAMAESSGRTFITSPNPDGGQNVGLWQLDTKGVGAGHTISELQDPPTNARITIMATANGTNWSHWESYTKKRYEKYL